MNAFTKENLVNLIDKVKASNTANPYCFYLYGTDIPDSMTQSVSEMFCGYEIIDRKNNVYLNGEKIDD
ncbi:MAG: hypothetical protein MJ230_07255 [bacterium]|nr:hypothetical protein [bacterium]